MPDLITLNSKIDDAPFQALHAQPTGRRRGGIVVVQEIFGIDRFMRADAARWAGLGFEVLVPSMFDRQQPGFVAEHDPDGMREGMKYAQANGLENPVTDVETCLDVLAPRGPVFVVGYCYGGGVAWLSACRLEDLAAASCYCGGMIQAYVHETPRCPTVLHFGGQDAHIPAETVRTAVAAHHPDLPVHIYEDAGHGFNNEGGMAYEEASATLARRRTLELFEQNGA